MLFYFTSLDYRVYFSKICNGIYCDIKITRVADDNNPMYFLCIVIINFKIKARKLVLSFRAYICYI